MRYAPIAQLDRVTDYESVGRGFESLSAYQEIQIPIYRYLDFLFSAGTRKINRNMQIPEQVSAFYWDLTFPGAN